MHFAESATVQTLRRDVAHQIARHAQHLGGSQSARARHLGIPQPTLSKIVNGRVADLSLELLIRIAVRAGLSMTLHTGRAPEEAGAFVAGNLTSRPRATASSSSEASRALLVASEHRLTPTQRLEAFLEHNQLVSQLHRAGQKAHAARALSTPPISK